MFYKAREKVIEIFDYFCIIVSEAKFKATHGKALKALTSK